MSNMSYCRFQNTANDLQDCIDALAEGGQQMIDRLYTDLTNGYPEEHQAFIRLAKLCRDFYLDTQHYIIHDEKIGL